MLGWFSSPYKQLARAVFNLMQPIPYKSERVETSFSAKQGLERGGMDCDDYARMWHDTLKVMGFDPQVIHGHYKGVYHAACVCEMDGTEYVFCNAHGRLTTMDRYPMTDITRLSKGMYQAWRTRYEARDGD